MEVQMRAGDIMAMRYEVIQELLAAQQVDLI